MTRSVLEHVVVSATDVSPNTNIVSGQQVYVYEEDGTTLLAQTMYAAATGNTTLSNPLTANASGFVKAYTTYPQRCVLKVNGVSYPSAFDLDPATPALHAYLPINVKMPPYNAVGDGVTDDTAAIQAALDAAYDATNGYRSVFFPRGHYMVTNLLVYAGTKLRGEGMGASFIEAISGATGIGLRERTVAEGNASGAQFIQLEGLTFDGHNRWTTCVNLGNQSAIEWSTQSGADHVMCMNATGAAMEVNCNVVAVSHLWCNSSSTGLFVYGSNFHATKLNCENNAICSIRIEGAYNTFVGTQLEDGGDCVPIRLNAGSNGTHFYGVMETLGSSLSTDFIQIADTVTDFSLHDVHVNTSGGTYTITNYYLNRTSTVWGNEQITLAQVDHGTLTYIANNGGVYVRSAPLIARTASIGVGSSSTANTFNTSGLTVNQGGGDDEALSLASSDIAHGMTSLTQTSTYGAFQKISAGGGGMFVDGWASSVGLWFRGNEASNDTTKSTSANGAIVLAGFKKSGTTTTSMDADSNIVVARTGGTTRFILDSDGDSHQDVGTAWTNFDSHDDLEILNSLAAAVARPGNLIGEEFVRWVTLKRPELERLGLARFNDGPGGDGSIFVNMSRLTMALVGCVRQVGLGLSELRADIDAVKLALPGAQS